MAIQRIVRWDVRSEMNPERHEYKFVIINDARGFNRLKQKFLEMAKPTDEESILAQGETPVSGISYFIWQVASYSLQPAEMEKRQREIYRGGDIKRHPDICARQGNKSLVTYVEQLINREEIPFA
jgi:hypothetical protein